ncbi:MAG: hypothetical protein ACREFW_04405 [Rhizomicrobium sp.]
MRSLFLVVILALLPLRVLAASNQEDGLFSQLKKAGSADAAKPIEDKLNQLFRISGSPSVDLLMSRAAAALGQADNAAARSLIDAVTSLAPHYAEGWRVKAQMQEAAGEDTGAMISLQRTILLNPRHFAAMTELAGMLEDYGDKREALKLYRRVLALDPHLKIAAEREKALAKGIEGQGI